MGLLSVVGSYSRRSARGRQFGWVRMRWWGEEWWARPTLRKTVYMLYQDRGSRRPTHGDAVGYSDAAPYGAGRVFTNADLLTPEGSHIIAHGCAVGPLGVANISMSSRVGVQNFEPLVQRSNPLRCLLPFPRPHPRRCRGLTYHAPVGGVQRPCMATVRPSVTIVFTPTGVT